MASPSAPQLACFLNANPTIRRINIAAFESHSYESSIPPIKLPELQNLTLEMGSEFTLWFFALLAPGTREISLQLYPHAPGAQSTQLIDIFRQFFQRSRIVTLRILEDCWIPFSSVAAYLPHLETLGATRPTRGYDLSDVDTQARLLPKLHTAELVDCTTRDVETGIGTILSLPSVRQIRFSSFHSVDGTGVTSMDLDEVGEWMRGLGVSASLKISPELLLFPSSSPFL